MDKKKLRRKINEKARALASEYKQASSEFITRLVTASREFAESDTIFVYVSMNNEPYTGDIIREAWEAGKRVCVPKCVDAEQMKAVEITSFEELEECGSHHLMEPVSTEKEVDPAAIDLAIIPCVSVSSEGYRLGHGAGYYDRFLEKASAGRDKPLKKMCLCFHILMNEKIPAEEWDICMDSVVTEHGIYRQ